MKFAIRRKVFETNSSSTHSVTICKRDDGVRLITSNLEKLLIIASHMNRFVDETVDLFLQYEKDDKDNVLKLINDYKENKICPICNEKHDSLGISLDPRGSFFDTSYLEKEKMLELAKNYFENKYYMYAFNKTKILVGESNDGADLAVKDDYELFNIAYGMVLYAKNFGFLYTLFYFIETDILGDDGNYDRYAWVDEIKKRHHFDEEAFREIFGDFKEDKIEFVRSAIDKLNLIASLDRNLEIVKEEFVKITGKSVEEVDEYIENKLKQFDRYDDTCACDLMYYDSSLFGCDSCPIAYFATELDFSNEEKFRKEIDDILTRKTLFVLQV